MNDRNFIELDHAPQRGVKKYGVKLYYENWKEQSEREAMLLRKANEENKSAVFNALAAAGITSVVVTFDGSGDEGLRPIASSSAR